jgi:PAS domain S-box-containing protein
MGHILVVDDEKSIRVTLKSFLIRDGHDIEVAEDADQAMGLLAKKDFDVVVSDIILPRITGVNLLKAIRKASPNVKVIMMTGEPTVETATESLRAGAFDYLSKPITKDVVLKVVRTAVNVKILEDEKRRLEEINRQYREELERIVEARTKSLQESEKRFRLAFENANEGIVLVDTDGSIITLNHRIADSLGYSRKELEGMNLNNYTHPEDLDVSPRFFRQSLAGGIDRAKFEKRYIHKDGHTIWGQVSFSTLRDAEGAPLYFISHIQDITERKLAEAELAKHREHLEEMVNNRTKELQEKNAELEHLNKLFVGREFRIKALKEKIKELEKEIITKS